MKCDDCEEREEIEGRKEENRNNYPRNPKVYHTCRPLCLHFHPFDSVQPYMTINRST